MLNHCALDAVVAAAPENPPQAVFLRDFEPTAIALPSSPRLTALEIDAAFPFERISILDHRLAFRLEKSLRAMPILPLIWSFA